VQVEFSEQRKEMSRTFKGQEFYEWAEISAASSSAERPWAYAVCFTMNDI
jgi:hypothetical protein